jgi:DNA-directed RNA polymerase subunit RPC12/RpoP
MSVHGKTFLVLMCPHCGKTWSFDLYSICWTQLDYVKDESWNNRCATCDVRLVAKSNPFVVQRRCVAGS